MAVSAETSNVRPLNPEGPLPGIPTGGPSSASAEADLEFARSRAVPSAGAETLEDLARLVASLKEELKDLKEKDPDVPRPRASMRTPLTKQRNVDKLPTFTGEGYLVYQDKIETCCEDEVGLRQMLKEAVKKLDVISAQTVRSMALAAGVDAKTSDEYNRELLALLKQTSDATPWNSVKGVKTMVGSRHGGG